MKAKFKVEIVTDGVPKSKETFDALILDYCVKSRLNARFPSFTLATCINISTAFDRLNPAKAVEALIRKGVNKDIALWYKDYLIDRHSYIEIKGVETIRRINIGCPQGGGTFYPPVEHRI